MLSLPSLIVMLSGGRAGLYSGNEIAQENAFFKKKQLVRSETLCVNFILLRKK